MFTVERRWRGIYQNLFRDRLVRKGYLAVADGSPTVDLPTNVRSHIVKTKLAAAARRRPGTPSPLTR